LTTACLLHLKYHWKKMNYFDSHMNTPNNMLCWFLNSLPNMYIVNLIKVHGWVVFSQFKWVAQVVMKVILHLIILVVSFTAAKAWAPFSCTPGISRESHSRIYGAISTTIFRVIDPAYYDKTKGASHGVHV